MIRLGTLLGFPVALLLVGSGAALGVQEPGPSYLPELESLGVLLPEHGIASTNLWAEGGLYYAEATRSPGPNRGPFVVFDLEKRQVIYQGSEAIHTGFRNIMVDRRGNAYFSVNETGLAKYDPDTNSVATLNVRLPGSLRASTRESADGWIYGATQQPNRLFKFRPSTEQVVDLGSAGGYTAHMVLDPLDRYLYFMPFAHGGAWRQGAPVLRFDTETDELQAIAFLNNLYERKYGIRVGGTYSMDIDPAGERLFISMNTSRLGVDRGDGFGTPALFVIHLSRNEAPTTQESGLRFRDVTEEAGLADLLFNSYVHTASWGDVDDNGLVDLFVGTFHSATTPVPHTLLLNHGGVFEDARQSAIEIEGRGAGSALVDLDADGDLDLFVSNNAIANQSGATSEPSRLFRNEGGVFVDVTAGSGIEAQSSNGRQVGVLDFDGDGLLDLFVVGDALRGSGPSVLLRNLGDFRFEEVTQAAGIPREVHGLGLAVGDVTGNGWPDVFVAGGPSSSLTNRNYLLLANGDGTYREMDNSAIDWTPFTTGREDWVSGGSFADLNRDGLQDLVVGHHFGTAAERGPGVPLRVYLNRGLAGADPVFEDITAASGIPVIDSKSPHVEVQDFDNDGWFDIYTSVTVETAEGTSPLIFRHRGLVGGDPRFESPNVRDPHYYPGGPTADYDGDGRLDVFLAEFRSSLGNGPVPSLLLKNTGASGNWIQVKVEDGETPMGLGAKVTVYRSGTEERLGFREIAVGYGFSSSQPAVAHFGLGPEKLIDIVVEMPHGGPVYRRESVPVNRLVTIPDASIEQPVPQRVSAVAVTDASEAFITPSVDINLPPHTIASKAPTVDFVPYPLFGHQGKPWSTWGGSIFASNGRFYATAGDHQTPRKSGGDHDGNTYLYEYDPATKRLEAIGDVLTAAGRRDGSGSWGHGKIHGRLDEGPDGYLYAVSYWGSRRGLVFDSRYRGSLLLRYPIRFDVPVGQFGGETP